MLTLCAAGAATTASSFARADVALWQLETPKVSPPYRISFTFTFDAARSRSVVFGGVGAVEADGGQLLLRDTWEWDGSQWSQRCTSVPCSKRTPAARQAPAVTYDSGRHKTVVYGGCADPGCNDPSLGDTWEWDGTSWTQACTSAPCNVTTPGPLADVAMAYDSARGKSVLLHTARRGSIAYAETWEWDGSEWTLACDGSAACPAPPSRTADGMAYDVARKQILAFGGYGGLDASGAMTYLHDLWSWNGSRWTELCTSPECSAKHPVASLTPAMAYDPRRATTLLYGGCPNGNCFEVPDSNMWEWNGTAWSEIPTSPGSASAPSSVTSGGMVYDSQRGQAVVAYGQGLGIELTMGLYDYRVVGEACVSGATCDTNVCEDGVCCEAACTSPCDTCASPASPGVCASRVACVTSCDGNHTLTTSDGKRTVDCSPYECEPGGKCKTTCTTPVDCASPNVCNAESRCASPPKGQNVAGGASSGCVVGDGDRPAAWLAAVAVAAALVSVKRRRRR